MFSNNLEDNSRGILIYVSKDVKCTQIFPNIGFNECVILELEDVSHHKMNIATIYKSSSSTTENDKKIIEYIKTCFCARNGNKLIMDDFNWPNINWNTWETSSNIEGKFVDCLRQNFLIQHINTPTSIRGTSRHPACVRSGYY